MIIETIAQLKPIAGLFIGCRHLPVPRPSIIMAEYKDDKWLDHLTPQETRQEGEIVRRFSASGRRISITDAVFGDIVEGGPNVSIPDTVS